jgi:hypothetical protein
MRKALVIIFAVAVLGGLGFYANKNKADNNLNTSGSSTTAVNPSQASSGSTASSSGNSGPVQLKDGTYSGGTADTPYGIVQVAAVISGGKISDIKFLQMPFEENRTRQTP